MKKNILLIGVGGTGSNAVDTFFKKFHELGNQTDNKVSALVFDTDAGDLKKITSAKTVVMADNASVGTICDRIGKQYLRRWFPCDAKDVRAQEMKRGASQWRKKSYLAFLNLMNKPAARATFISALEDMVQDPGAGCEIYVIASVAGGTGSGSFIPIALYAKRYLRKNLGKDPIVNAMIALPDIYADEQTPENRVKVFSNAYAILRELNAINLVARNYNSGLASKKKAPIRFKIGHEDEPNVGVLFDASDERYWTPEAAPFSQIFLLDRIPGLHSISAHDMVLANSLYTIICTEIGSAFDSEFSNHELVRSQNNGSNAIYAGISTSQVRFPSESVLNYLAYKKTLASCEDEWLILHTAAENAIKEKEREAKAAKRRFSLGNDEYADIVIKAMEQKQDEDCDSLLEIIDRGVQQYDDDDNRISETAGERFVKMIDAYIATKIPSEADVIDNILDYFPAEKAIPKPTRSTVADLITDTLPTDFSEYFVKCLEAVKCVPGGIADSVITLNKKKIGTIGERYSIVKNLLMLDENTYVHPVAALIRLCQFRLILSKKCNSRLKDWPEMKKRDITAVPERYFNNIGVVNEQYAAKSAYASLGDTRYSQVYANAEEYMSSKTKVQSDLSQLKIDAETIVKNIMNDTRIQITNKVYTAIANDVEKLISKYRSFFLRFEKEKETLEEQVADAHRKDEGPIDSIINVYSSKDDKDAISTIVDEGNGPVTSADIRMTDSIVGEGVYKTVFAAAVAEASDEEDTITSDSGAFRSIFNCMVDAYRTSIGKGEMFREVSSYNAIEAILASCGENADPKKIDDALRSVFTVAQDLAIPPLRLDPNLSESDLVTPSSIMVFMISLNTAKYIKRNAEKFGLKVPADQTSESSILKSCAEQFLHDYSGNTSARVAIVDSIPDQILYCTGEIMDITPLCISKFNELDSNVKMEDDDCVVDSNDKDADSENKDSYFRHYREALRRYRKYDTDMWNPHIGNDLYKRGYLPYMNPKMEEICDEKMVKALLYAFSKDLVRYADGVGATSYGKYYFVYGQNKIRNSENQPINEKNISQILGWLRNEDDNVEEWSHNFDMDIEEQKQALPSIISDSEVGTLEAQLTNSPFMKLLNSRLFVDPVESKKAGKKVGPSAIEFAYRIKTCEEIGRDCDDAERILRVLYKVFVEMISFRVSPELNPERFIQIYTHELNKFYEAFAKMDAIAKAGKNCETYYAQLVEWMNREGLFLNINNDSPYDEAGRIAINKPFHFQEVDSIVKILEKIKGEDKNEDVPAEDDAE